MKNTDGSEKEVKLLERLFYLMILLPHLESKENQFYEVAHNLDDLESIKKLS